MSERADGALKVQALQRPFTVVVGEIDDTSAGPDFQFRVVSCDWNLGSFMNSSWAALVCSIAENGMTGAYQNP